MEPLCISLSEECGKGVIFALLRIKPNSFCGGWEIRAHGPENAKKSAGKV
jgi:hypothetical protein